MTLYVLRPGIRATLALGARRPRHALRRRGARRPAPRLLELRLLAPRADQPGQGGLEGRPLRPAAGRHDEFIPLPEVGPKTVSYPMSLARRPTCIALLHRRHPQRPAAAAGGGEAIVLLHGFPESHRTWRAVAPALAEDYSRRRARPARLRRLRQAGGRRSYETDRILDDLIALADALGLKRFTLVGHDWGGAVAWLAALKRPGPGRAAVIVNAPHPLVFQKSLIEDEAQRAASQYITAFRNPGDGGRASRRMGFETFYEKTFGSHADLSLIPPEERQAYLDQWSAPGALTAMLNWYRASEIVVPAPARRRARRPGRWRPSRSSPCRRSSSGASRTRRCCRSSSRPAGACARPAHRRHARRRPFHPVGVSASS